MEIAHWLVDMAVDHVLPAALGIAITGAAAFMIFVYVALVATHHPDPGRRWSALQVLEVIAELIKSIAR